MTFVKDKAYWTRAVINLERAIEGTKNALTRFQAEGCEQRVVDAHLGQISHYENELKKAKTHI